GITAFSSGNDNTASLASKTMRNVASQFVAMQHDGGVIDSFSCLLLLVEASKKSDPITYLAGVGLPLSPQFSSLELARALKQHMQANEANREYSAFASQALIDTVRQWTQQQQSQQLLAFSGSTDAFDPWRKAANPGGFTDAGARFLHLAAIDLPGYPHNLALDIEQFDQLVHLVDDRVRDLLEIAAFIYGADRLITR
nr:hypothetical protein [Tanacetum cinerariifolium]